MSFTVQDDTGTVAGANAYNTVAEFKTYHDDRGNDYSAFSDEQIQIASINGADYTDIRFKYIGNKLHGRDQVTEWPRGDAVDRSGDLVIGVPIEVKEAAMEYAFRALSASLVSDPDRDTTGAVVKSKSEQVGPIKSSVSYALDGTFSMPRYPLADQKLLKAGLVVSGGRVRRS